MTKWKVVGLLVVIIIIEFHWTTSALSRSYPYVDREGQVWVAKNIEEIPQIIPVPYDTLDVTIDNSILYCLTPVGITKVDIYSGEIVPFKRTKYIQEAGITSIIEIGQIAYRFKNPVSLTVANNKIYVIDRDEKNHIYEVRRRTRNIFTHTCLFTGRNKWNSDRKRELLCINRSPN
ncbi:MAG: hypothetical protein AB1422_08930 [bacterium]